MRFTQHVALPSFGKSAAVWGLVLAAVLVGARAEAGDALKVVATLPDLADLARQVGGDRVEVEAIVKGYQDPHYLEPKPSYARMLRKADLLVYVGLELEAAWLPKLLDTSRNPDLQPGSPHLLAAGDAVENLLEVPTGQVDRSQGDIHPFGNPHLHLDPRNMILIAEAIAERLQELDSAHADGYASRLETYRKSLEDHIRDWEERAAPLRGRKVVAYHKQWEYLVNWLGIDVVGYIENRPGIPPSPKHVQDLIETMKAEDVGIVIAATFVDLDAAGKVADRSGADLVVLPASVGGVDGTESYVELIDVILNRILNPGS